MRAYKSVKRNEAAQGRYDSIMDQLTIETGELVERFLVDHETVFDFQAIFYQIAADFNYASPRGVCMRRDLRNMEAVGLLKRGQMETTIRGVGNQEYQRVVATWHIPESFERDTKFLKALPELLRLKNHEGAPTKVMKTAMLGDFNIADPAWLIGPVVDWLNGKSEHIVLPDWFISNRENASLILVNAE